MRNPFLIGSTVYLRPVEPEDARLVVPWFNDPEVIRLLLRWQPMTVAEELDYLQRMRLSGTDCILGIVVRETDDLIGLTGLHHIDARNRHASFGITIGDK